MINTLYRYKNVARDNLHNVAWSSLKVGHPGINLLPTDVVKLFFIIIAIIGVPNRLGGFLHFRLNILDFE